MSQHGTEGGVWRLGATTKSKKRVRECIVCGCAGRPNGQKGRCTSDDKNKIKVFSHELLWRALQEKKNYISDPCSNCHNPPQRPQNFFVKDIAALVIQAIKHKVGVKQWN